jgi:hypothetical protein
MKSFFQDEFINSKVLSRLAKEIRQEQLDSTIDEISYLNELQSHIISRCDLTPSQNQELANIKKANNAKRKNLQA